MSTTASMTELKVNAFFCLLGLHGKIEQATSVTMVGCNWVLENGDMLPIPDHKVTISRCESCSKAWPTLERLTLAEAQEITAS